MLIIMLPMLVFSFTIVDICKIFMAKDVAAEASQLALNAGMTSYDKVLKDMYGILATSQSEDDLSVKMSKYYAATLAAQGITDDGGSDKIISDFLNSLDSANSEVFKNDSSYLKVNPEKSDGKYVAVNAFDSSAASNPAVMERQIIEYMKYRGPVNMASGMLEKLISLKDLPNQAAVTQERMEFEKTLSSINNNAIDAYTLLELYFYNNERAEGSMKNFEIVHADEKQKFINAYKFSGTGVKAGGLFNETEFAKIEAQLKSASMAVMFYSPFYEHLQKKSTLTRNNLGSAATNVTYLVDNMKNMMDDLDGKNPYKLKYPDGIDLDDLLDAAENLRTYANKICQFNSASWSESSFTAADEENAIEAIYSVWYFSKMFHNGKGGDATNDFSDSVKEFMEDYKALEVIKTETENEEDKQKITEAMSYTQSGTGMTPKELYDALDDAMDDIAKYVPLISQSANQAFTAAANRLIDIYDFANKQITIIDLLAGSNGYIRKVMSDFEQARDQAGTYQDAINNVDADNQRNSSQQTFDHEANNIKDIDYQVGEDIIKELMKQRPYYEKLRDAVLSVKFMTEYDGQPSDHQVILKTSDKNNISVANKRYDKVEYYATKRVRNEVTGFYTYTFALPGYTHKGESLGLGAWTEHKNDKILENKLYKEIVKMSEPQSNSEKKPDAKNKLIENTSTSGVTTDGSEGGNSVKVEGASKLTPPKDAVAFAAMASAQKFSDYIAGNEEATSVISQTVTLDDSKMRIDGSCSTNKDDDAKTADNASSMIGNVSNLMSQISKILENGRDAILVTEYLTKNFSCHTTSMDGKGNRKNDEEMLSGMLFYTEENGEVHKNVAYGSELEYILYGMGSEAANKAAAGGTIFAVRFVLNLIYSFTDSEIRNTTHAIALLAAGVFPFAVPLVQTVLHIGLALAESAVDLSYLTKGAAVPLFKTKNTWVCKASNAVRKVVGTVVSDVEEKIIDAAADKLCGVIDKAGDKVNEWTGDAEKALNEYVNDKLNSAQSMIQDAVLSPIREVIEECTNRVKEFQNMGRPIAVGKIEEMLNTALEKVKNAYKNESENYIYVAIYNAADRIDTGNVAGIIYDNLQAFIDSAVKMSIDVNNQENGQMQEQLEKLDDLIEKKLSSVINTIQNAYNEVSGKLTGLIKEGVQTVVTAAKGGIEAGAEELKGMINEKVNSFMTGHKDYAITTGKEKTLSMEHLLDMTYQDYLYIFVLIGYVANRDAMLQRAALLMQANCVARGGEKSGYTLNTARTFFQITSGASTSTVFYGAIFKDGELDMSGARKKYEFTQMAYMGY